VRRCLVLGAALCLFDDIEAALDMSPVEGVVAVKGAGKVWNGQLDAWVGLHPEMMLADYKVREARGYPRADKLYVHDKAPIDSPLFDQRIDYLFPGQTKSGSSGLFGVKVALELGFDRIVLCGVPLVREAGKIDKGEIWHGADSYKAGWHQVLPQIAPYVRSMSGWTRQLLGAPDAAFGWSDAA
jgi:hypothetical protein